MRVVVIDGQGGRLGCLLIEQLKKTLPQAEIWAIGTNSAATSAMMKAGAHAGATGENPVKRAVKKADAVFGPLGIVVAHAIMGEVTPEIALEIAACDAKKYLVPMNSCGVMVAGIVQENLGTYAKMAVEDYQKDLNL